MFLENIVIDYLFDNYLEFIFFSVILTVFFALITRKFNFGIIDPINFYLIFTFSTSYSVVIILFFGNFININLFSMIFLYGMILSLGIIFGFKLKYKIPSIKIYNDLTLLDIKKLLYVLSLIYLVCIFYYISNLDFNKFFISRFEANKGMGHIVRFCSILRLFILSIFGILFCHDKSIRMKFYFIIFLLFSSFFTGSKIALLDALYVTTMVYVVYSGNLFKMRIENFAKILIFSFIVLLFSLFFFEKLADHNNMLSKYTNLPIGVELLLLRIFANGDMYYLGLINNIIYDVVSNVSSFISLIFRPYIGPDLSLIFFNSADPINIGRAIWEYWYPYSFSGGSVDHFDLAAYSYFGFYLGMIFVFFLGFYLGLINRLKKSILHSNIKNKLNTAFFGLLYCKSYILLLAPATGVVLIIDMIFIYLFILFILLLLRSVK